RWPWTSARSRARPCAGTCSSATPSASTRRTWTATRSWASCWGRWARPTARGTPC
ncbi:unnamed protein product, partial [Heterosigma akashiwo]